MSVVAIPSAWLTLGATFSRELLSYRINRFLYLHAALMFLIGALAWLVPPEAAHQGVAWWVLNGVLFLASLSALLLGLSSAQAEADEFPMLFTQPIRTGAWVAGKCAGLASVVLPSAALLVLPILIVSGPSVLLAGAGLAAAGVTLLFAWLGLAVGLWVRDPVRGLIATLGLWFVMLFGADLVLILVGGAPWIHEYPAAWVSVLMANPLDAYRVTLLFVVEQAAFSGSNLHGLTRWWLANPVLWLALCLALWCGAAVMTAFRAANRRRLS